MIILGSLESALRIKCCFVWYKNLDRAFFRFVIIYAFDRQTDGQTEFSSLDRVCIPYSAVIKSSSGVYQSQ